MDLQKDYIYHIFNQGNNRQEIFFNRANYLYFMGKIKTYVLPYADVFAWCLMPNHFHLMVKVNKINLSISLEPCQGLTLSQALTSNGACKLRTFNDSIGILLRSYTRAINKQEKRTGSLFRKETKAECITQNLDYTPSFYNTQYGTIINSRQKELQYPQICFNYIHQNPVKAGMVKKATDWEFSSARAYANLSEDILVNKLKARKYIGY
ncbi:MAG: hypothetical protein C0596_05905 [Marinilabiliales bacterium]|nr:MAG: hypothetical protein C0596_05905 [Marinilabiliales bacterium]